MSSNEKNRSRGKKRVTFRTREEAMQALKRVLERPEKSSRTKDPKPRGTR